MEIIHTDEVTHVTAGHRWFMWLCERGGEGGGDKLDPVSTFRDEVKKGWRGDIKGPFNVVDRERAGLGREFYEGLRGELRTGVEEKIKAGKEEKKEVTETGKGGPGVKLEYEQSG